ncbi:RES family NAD+ phosphorylase [soil metagenome]
MSAITLWRICAPQYADTAYSGEGARIFGGRWNSKGRAVIYASESIALAVLEQLVHVEDLAVLNEFVAVKAVLDESHVETLGTTSLPADWRAYPSPPSLRVVGDAWLSESRSLALRVPSVTVKRQYNYLINPAHPDLAGIETSDPEPLDLDPRITGF